VFLKKGLKDRKWLLRIIVKKGWKVSGGLIGLGDKDEGGKGVGRAEGER
jgi:hypothetical protein